MIKKEEVNLVIIFGLSAFISVLQAILTAPQKSNVLELLSYFLIPLGAIYFVLHLTSTKQTPKPPTDIFEGVRRYKFGDNTWARKQQTEKIANEINSSKSRVCLITGTSGTGKSVLMQTQVIPELERLHPEMHHRIVSSYTNMKDKLIELEQESARFHKDGLLIVFDQFEQITARPQEEQRALADFIKSLPASQRQVPCVIIVRPDYYYQLKFLEDLLPNPKSAIEVPGIDVSPEGDEYKNVVDLLEQVATKKCIENIFADFKSDSYGQACGQILPLELMMVGQMLHIQCKNQRHRPVEPSDYSGKAQLIKEYFRNYIQSSPHPNAAVSVLFALTAKTVLRRSLNLREICSASFYPQEVIEETISFFEKEGLVSRTETQYFEWTHDQLSSRFRDFSTSEIDSTLRDNITYLVERNSRDVNFTSNIIDANDAKTVFRKRMVIWLLIFMAIGTAVRMLQPALFGNPFNDPSLDIMGPLYQGFGLAQLAWATYVAMVCGGFFARVKLKASLVSYLLIFVLGTLVVIVCWFYPRSWFLGIAFIGLLVGLCFWWVSYANSPKKRLRNTYRHYIRGIIISSLMTSIVGAGYLILTDKYIHDNSTAVVIVSLVFVFFHILIAAYIIVSDAMPDAFEILLGLIDRTQQAKPNGVD